MFSYIDLLVDVAESFSVMIVILVIISSSVTLLVHIHSLSSSASLTSNKASYGMSYNAYTKFIQFKNRL